MKSRPLVSVVIPTYNAPALLCQTLTAVFGQTLSDYEVIVVDDGSTDDTALQLAEFAREHAAAIAGRLRVVTQQNQGIGGARNRGIAEATGKYVALLDHDDLWLPQKLEKQVTFMQRHPECVACTVPWSLSPEPDRPLFEKSEVSDGSGIVDRPLGQMARGVSLMITSSLMIERSRLEGLSYEIERDTIEDLSFQMRLMGRGAVGVAGDSVLMVYRIHEGNFSRAAIRRYNGVRLLRGHERAGLFEAPPGVPAEQWRRDVNEYLCVNGREAAMNLVLAGYRMHAAEVYLRELPHQIGIERWRFALFLPLVLLAPEKFLRKRWPTTRAV